MFKFKINLTNGKTVRIPELTNRDLLTLIKYCIFDDCEGINLFVEDKIFKDTELNCIEKFYVLLFLRTIYVGNEITITANASFTDKVTLSLNSILEKIENIDLPAPIKLTLDENIIITLQLPSKLYYNTIDDMYFDLIKTITINNTDIDFTAVDDNAKNKILDCLPNAFMGHLMNTFTEFAKCVGDVTIVERDDLFQIDTIKISLLSNQPCAILKQLYSQDLTGFLEFIYQFVNKVGGSFDDALNLNINDCKIMFSFYVEEIKKQNEELKKGSKV